MEFHGQEPAAQFDSGDQAGLDLGLGGQEARQAAQGVVVGEGQGHKAGRFGQGCQGLGCVRAIGEQGVAVEIDHDPVGPGMAACLFAR